MKQVFTISLDERTVQKVREYTRSSSYRNKSHVVESAILKFLEGEKNES